MVPQNLNTVDDGVYDVAETSEPDLTFRIVDGEVIAGTVDGIEAVKQAIAIILDVERYEHYIYSWQFGTEFAELIGTDTAYACPEITRRITDALSSDDRILDVYDFQFTQNGSTITCDFKVKSIYGEVAASKEVNI